MSPVAPRRVVLDPRLVLRALLQSTPEARVWRLDWQQGRVQPLVSASIARLLMRALAHPGLQLGAQAQQELLADFLPYAEVVKLAPVVTATQSREFTGLAADLQPMVALALAGQAQALISDEAGLHRWAAARRTKAARELCTVCASTDWKSV